MPHTDKSNNEKAQFLSTVIGLVSPYGSHHDPAGKEGLSEAVMEIFKFGTKRFPDSAALFTALEKTGAVLETRSDTERSAALLSVPKENRDEARGLLTEIYKNTVVNEAALEKIKSSLMMNLNELESDDLQYTRAILRKTVLNEHIALGTKESLANLTQKDLEGHLDRLNSNHFELEVYGSGLWNIDRKPELEKSVEASTDATGGVTVLPRDIEQKVLSYGLRCKGLNDYEYAIRVVANGVLSTGLVGLIPEKIREEHSAAYYAFASMDFMLNKGMIYVGAGVSEANLPKALQLIIETYDQVASGDFEQSRIDVAKKYVKGSLDRAFDNLPALADFYNGWICRGKEIPSYQSLVDQLASVTKDDVSSYFASIVNNSKGSVVVNGKLDKKSIDKCEELMKND